MFVLSMCCLCFVFFFFKQKTAYEMRISDWSSDVCSSDLLWAGEQGLPVRTPKSLKSEDAQAEFAALDLDVAVVAAYGLILPQAILNAPRAGCLNVHGSILPRWRGAAPVQRAILSGDAAPGVTLMPVDIGLDPGAIERKNG